MPQATGGTGTLNYLNNCFIKIPSGGMSSCSDFNGYIYLKVLPDISDSKSAAYTPETITGRAFPFKTFSHGEERSISMTLHLVVCEQSDIKTNLCYLRALESLVYPGQGTSSTPYVPPPIAQIQCGKLLADAPLCAVLKSYSVKFPTEVAWDAGFNDGGDATYLPYKFDVDLTWEIVYDSSNLPGQERIIQTGG